MTKDTLSSSPLDQQRDDALLRRDHVLSGEDLDPALKSRWSGPMADEPCSLVQSPGGMVPGMNPPNDDHLVEAGLAATLDGSFKSDIHCLICVGSLCSPVPDCDGEHLNLDETSVFLLSQQA